METPTPAGGPPRKEQIDAANELVATLARCMGSEKGVHAVTAVAAVSRMAGTFLLQSLQLPLGGLVPGTPVLSEGANERGPALVDRLGRTLVALRVPLDGAKIDYAHTTTSGSKMSLAETQRLLMSPFAAVCAKHGLDALESAMACALATAFVISQTARALNPNTAFAVAAYGFVEGSKTVPTPPAS